MLAAYPKMMRRDRKRLGLTVARAAWELSIKPADYRKLEAGEGQIASYDLWCAMCELFEWPQGFAVARR